MTTPITSSSKTPAQIPPAKPGSTVPGFVLALLAVLAAAWMLMTNQITATCQQGYDPTGHFFAYVSPFTKLVLH